MTMLRTVHLDTANPTATVEVGPDYLPLIACYVPSGKGRRTLVATTAAVGVIITDGGTVLLGLLDLYPSVDVAVG